MTETLFGWLLLAAQAAATATPTTQPVPPPTVPPSAEPADATLEAQFADALAEDTAKAARDTGPATPTSPAGSSPSFFNPAMTVIATLTGGLWRKNVEPTF